MLQLHFRTLPSTGLFVHFKWKALIIEALDLNKLSYKDFLENGIRIIVLHDRPSFELPCRSVNKNSDDSFPVFTVQLSNG